MRSEARAFASLTHSLPPPHAPFWAPHCHLLPSLPRSMAAAGALIGYKAVNVTGHALPPRGRLVHSSVRAGREFKQFPSIAPRQRAPANTKRISGKKKSFRHHRYQWISSLNLTLAATTLESPLPSSISL